jgi:branched-chain amino acid transport system permease protein
MIILSILIKYTKLGKAMRAASQDRVMAKLSGVNVNKVISATFVIGAVAAAIGGVLIASHVRQINYFMGFMVGIKAFIAAVLGGIGSIPGAVLGAFILGITESLATMISSAYKDVISFVILIIILTFLPAGILGKSEKEKV